MCWERIATDKSAMPRAGINDLPSRSARRDERMS